MAIDTGQVLRAALEAAMQDHQREPQQRKRGSTGRAFLIGAGLFTVGRIALRSRGGSVLEGLQGRLVEYEERLRGDDAEDEEFEDDDFEEDEE